MLLSDSQRMRDADSTAINECGIPSTLLMQNAAGHLARAAFAYAQSSRRACIFCGSGNNGGDGVAAALYLMRWGCGVRVLLVGRREHMSADTREMERRLIELGGALEPFDPAEPGLQSYLESCGVIVDAVFGIGLNRPVKGMALEAIERMNTCGVPVVSADIPSGVEADTGRILGAAVHARETVTFSMAKPGHFVEPGCTCCGKLSVREIGIPDEVLEKAQTKLSAMLDGELTLPARPPVSHKGSYGKLLIAAGSVGYTGAPTLCARGAVRAGAGLVYLGVPRCIYSITAVKNDEAMPFPLPDDGAGGLGEQGAGVLLEKLASCDALALGPGLGRGNGAVAACLDVITRCDKPMVLDADALYALSRDMGAMKRATAPMILTPHDGEFVRMGGILTGDRVGDALRFAWEHECILVLKGHRSIVAFPDSEVYITTHGNPGMAKGGTGDVLTGVIGALLGQMPVKEAVKMGVFLHSLAGDMCREQLGEYAMTAGDIIEELSRASIRLMEQE